MDKAHLLSLLVKVSDEFYDLSNLDSPESVNPNEDLLKEIEKAILDLQYEN